jgi:hypothetical protein
MHGDELLARVDHFVFASPDLAAGIAQIEEVLGVRATPGGQHPGRGTCNALISIGPRAYIEIIGPDPDQPTPADPRPFGIDGLSAPRLVTWAANATDLARVSNLASRAGLTLGELGAGSRRRPDGRLLTWSYTDPRTVVAGGVVPFFIDWGHSPHPAESAASGGRLIGLRAEHPDADRVGAQLARLGLRLVVDSAPQPALIAAIDGPRGQVELR